MVWPGGDSMCIKIEQESKWPTQQGHDMEKGLRMRITSCKRSEDTCMWIVIQSNVDVEYLVEVVFDVHRETSSASASAVLTPSAFYKETNSFSLFSTVSASPTNLPRWRTPALVLRCTLGICCISWYLLELYEKHDSQSVNNDRMEVCSRTFVLFVSLLDEELVYTLQTLESGWTGLAPQFWRACYDSMRGCLFWFSN